MNREEAFENIEALASKERVERRKENEEILRELKEIKELLKEKNNSNNRVITRYHANRNRKNSIAIALMECIYANLLKKGTG